MRRGGFIFEWWVGDHEPRPIHISDSNGKLLGGVAVADFMPLDNWQPPRKVIELITHLKAEGHL